MRKGGKPSIYNYNYASRGEGWPEYSNMAEPGSGLRSDGRKRRLSNCLGGARSTPRRRAANKMPFTVSAPFE